MKVKVHKLDGKAVTGAGSEIELDDAVFGVTPRADILHRVVTWQLENRRAAAYTDFTARCAITASTGVTVAAAP